MPSYYCPQLEAQSSLLSLEEDEYHHLSRVKRKTVGDLVLLNSGRGILAEAKIVQMQKTRALLEVQKVQIPAEPKPQFAIALALLKNHHDELAIQKCTELGVRDIFPLQTKYSVRNAGKNTVARFCKIALSAIKQCDNPHLPVVHEVQELVSSLAYIVSQGYALVLCSERQRELWLQDLDLSRNICFIIGPEGGFCDSEFEAMQGLPSVMLSPLISRAETAAITVSAQFVGLRAGLLQNSL